MNFKEILAECLKAYADCNDEGGAQDNRNLNFRSQFPVTSSQYLEIMKRCTPAGYNLFDEVAAANVAALFGDKAEYYVAREGSVCVYVKAEGRTWFQREVGLHDLKADEISFEGKSLFRIWWD